MEQEIKSNNAAKFAFYYVLSLVALIFMSIGTGMVLFQLINKYITDIINQYSANFQPDVLKFAISALLIATPIYFFTTRVIHKNLFSGDLAKNSEVRKWLTYFILLVTSVIMIGWFISLVNNFLNGELTLKIGLKALVAIAINAGIFSFYLYDIKRENVAGMHDRVIKIYSYASLAFVIIVFITSLFIVESPSITRNRKIDERVIENINQLSPGVESYYQEFKVLPKDFSELRSKITYITDETFLNPATGKTLEYKVTGDKTYELCSDFLTSNRDQQKNYNYPIDNTNMHDAGHQCLQKRIVNIDNTVPAVKTMDAPIVQQ